MYDFGDWIEHRITAQEIVELEAEVAYPRIVAQNKPRYRNGETCRAQKRETRAPWICLEGSKMIMRASLLVRDLHGARPVRLGHTNLDFVTYRQVGLEGRV